MPREFSNGEITVDSFVFSCNLREKRHIEDYLTEELGQIYDIVGEKALRTTETFNQEYDVGFYRGFEKALNMIRERQTSEEDMVQARLDNIEENRKLKEMYSNTKSQGQKEWY